MRKSEPHTAVGSAIEHRDKSGIDPSSRRALIAAKARNNPNEKFNNLIHHLDPGLVMEQLKKMRLKSAPGSDQMTVAQARENLEWLLPPILRQVHGKQYEAPPVRRVYIPKADGKQRPIGVPQVIDRGLQAAMFQILSEIYEQDFLQSSFGFRPKLGCHNALATINEIVDQRKLNFALEVDIRDFFGSINHDWMMTFLGHRISDKRVLKLIESWLKAGVMEEGKWRESEVGTPQGGSISPLLSNIYLHYVLDLWFEKKIKKQLRGKAHLVRYCDDFVIFFENQEDMVGVDTLLKARLSQFGLTVADEKTHQTDLTPRPSTGARDRRRITFLGFNIFRGRKRSGTGHKTVYQTDGKRFTRAKASMKEQLWRMMHWDVKAQAAKINSILRGHFNYYGLAGNARKTGNFWNETVLHWRHCLSRRSQKGKLNWKQVREILVQNPLQRPQIKVPYPSLRSYARL